MKSRLRPLHSKILGLILAAYALAGCAIEVVTTAITPESGSQPVIGTSVAATSPPLSEITPSLGTATLTGSPETPEVTAVWQQTLTPYRIVGMQGNGSTITLLPGQYLILMLDDSYDWQVSLSDPAILIPVEAGFQVDGSQAIFKAGSGGQAELIASGDPLCRKVEPPCMMPSILFSVHLVVE